MLATKGTFVALSFGSTEITAGAVLSFKSGVADIIAEAADTLPILFSASILKKYLVLFCKLSMTKEVSFFAAILVLLRLF